LAGIGIAPSNARLAAARLALPMRERTRYAGYKGSQAACSRARLALAVRTLLSKRSIDDTIVFHPAITFVIGENRTGKSTVLEAIAVGWGRNPERHEESE